MVIFFGISTILQKLQRSSVISAVIPVALVIAGLFAGFISSSDPSVLSAKSQNVVFGGPESVAFAATPKEGLALFESVTPSSEIGLEGTLPEEQVASLVGDAYLVNPNHPLSGTLPTRGDTLIHTVQSGDTLSGIAAEYGISLNTLLWANSDKLKGGYLPVGTEVIILPVSGVLHRAREGETIRSISALYGVPEEKIIEVNRSSVSQLVAGTMLVIPGGRPRTTPSSQSVKLPSIPGYFTLPATGWNWGEIHPYNAVDIANACGTPIYAAQEGLVTRIGSPTQWNGGYGGFIEIEHPNKTLTRYAHLQEILVAPGDYVSKKQNIAEMGNTGNVHGNPGCHLHFEVDGAKNPLAR
ncbi:MAG: hypothetical protein COU07_03825 [Candidatus Harrisonbacteria bacterium CG10_big_fil_rev_8_21_14_0_10_40_38]|uniref:LysM domain-containing protein n=1 Tax=Candidatus Harrisonbacteria bacterium CG10_big_fil_rev_8_21_14_0_10_40_38 TaxID=1974583 RepID=A0A2H0URH1_9BACT|nr:MAG: hypothetical protein COU07_03825 [Candidatus Harrisonbacteria bacterium CG10_big_fil_rev_8_21_14_0_10_40_38]